MRSILHHSESRGRVESDWLTSFHTFSFASYHNPNRMGFGKLRVLNDDFIQPNMGFDMHPHNNMEIVSILISGRLRHQDSMGNEYTISSGEIQIMSAGTGIIHSEFNDSSSELVNLLQIWVIPNKRNITPRYQQKMIDTSQSNNQFLSIVSPKQDDNNAVWINQEAYFSLATLESGKAVVYQAKVNNPALYIFVISGKAMIGDQVLLDRDAMAIEEFTNIEINAQNPSKLLAIETSI